ncbi:acyl-CoA-like ligand-binding transcription factor [Streptomyces triticirhizae]|uniref:acyl-CoA-like ligand-binding transcription factor n=1 Tax=Streptomyces triticirhizae TaxID=2483353 RepID=UPI0013155979
MPAGWTGRPALIHGAAATPRVRRGVVRRLDETTSDCGVVCPDRPCSGGIGTAIAEAAIQHVRPAPSEHRRVRARLIRDIPSLEAEQLQAYADIERSLALVIAARTGTTPHADLFPGMAASVAVGAIRAALCHWLDTEKTCSCPDLLSAVLREVGARSARGSASPAARGDRHGVPRRHPARLRAAADPSRARRRSRGRGRRGAGGRRTERASDGEPPRGLRRDQGRNHRRGTRVDRRPRGPRRVRRQRGRRSLGADRQTASAGRGRHVVAFHGVLRRGGRAAILPSRRAGVTFGTSNAARAPGDKPPARAIREGGEPTARRTPLEASGSAGNASKRPEEVSSRRRPRPG